MIKIHDSDSSQDEHTQPIPTTRPQHPQQQLQPSLQQFPSPQSPGQSVQINVDCLYKPALQYTLVCLIVLVLVLVGISIDLGLSDQQIVEVVIVPHSEPQLQLQTHQQPFSNNNSNSSSPKNSSSAENPSSPKTTSSAKSFSSPEHPQPLPQLTPEQMNETIKIMQSFPPSRSLRSRTPSLQPQINLAFSLSQEPYNLDYLAVEYELVDAKFQIRDVVGEVPICVAMVGRNLGNKFAKMFQSIFRQNYSNYHVVYVDDSSTDKTKSNIQSYLLTNPNQDKVNIVWQKQRKYALENRNLAIRQHCAEGDVVLDVDADDWLIGNQVFRIVNAVYANPLVWAAYFNNITPPTGQSPPSTPTHFSIDQTMQVLQINKYRTSNIWRTTQLRTYRRQLYMKIDVADFRDEQGRFYQMKSDAFVNFAVVELAGTSHTRFFQHFLYYYDTASGSRGPSAIKKYCRAVAKTQTPYLPLDSLQSQPIRMPNYTAPQELLDLLAEAKKELGA